MITYEHFLSLPIVGVAFGFFYKAFNGKMTKGECLRVHEALDKRITENRENLDRRLNDIHEDLIFIKNKLT